MRPVFTLLLLCAVPAAFAQDAPRRKSGLWEITMSSPQLPKPMTLQQCVDEKTDDLSARPQQPGVQEKCSKKSVRREGNRVVFESVCQVEGSTATSRGEFTGDFASAYGGDVVTKFSPPMHGMAESKMSFKARHAGPCAPGQKPGAAAMQGTGGTDMQKMMEDARAGKLDPDKARRMAEEMRKQYGK